MIPAAKQLGLGMAATIVTFAWSDMMTDIIQPFWAIAVLAVATLNFRDIMVYVIITSVVFLFFLAAIPT
jgi:short-chain fatty acids transporter